jgi:thiol-disulfide isomerase/thioredoxin
MRKTSFFMGACLLGLALSSCSGDRVVFSVSNDPALPYFERNGELLLRQDAAKNGYYDIANVVTSSTVIEALKHDEYVNLLFFSSTCNPCLTFEPVYDAFVLDSLLYAYAIDALNDPNALTAIAGAFPKSNFASVFAASTPTLYFCSPDGVATKLDFYAHTSSISDFESFMAPRMNLTATTRFKSFAAYSKWAESNEGLLLVESLSEAASSAFYEDHVRSLARHVDKPIALIDIDAVNEADRTAFATTLGYSDIHTLGLTKKGGTLSSSFNYVNDSSSAIAAVEAYLNA